MNVFKLENDHWHVCSLLKILSLHLFFVVWFFSRPCPLPPGDHVEEAERQDETAQHGTVHGADAGNATGAAAWQRCQQPQQRLLTPFLYLRLGHGLSPHLTVYIVSDIVFFYRFYCKLHESIFLKEMESTVMMKLLHKVWYFYQYKTHRNVSLRDIRLVRLVFILSHCFPQCRVLWFFTDRLF